MESRVQRKSRVRTKKRAWSRKLLSCLAAIHEVRGTRDERRLGGCEKYDGLGDLFGSPYSFEWNGRRYTRFSLRSASESAQHPSLDWTWGHHVDAYPRRRGFDGRRLSQSFDRMLARRLDGRPGSTSIAVALRQVNNAAPS